MVTIKGYRDQALPLRWYVIDLGTHDIVDQQSKRQLLEADRNEAPAVWPFWVALPDGPGPFKIVLQVFPPNAKSGQPGVVPLAEAETDPFPGVDLAQRAQLEGEREQADELAADEARRPAGIGRDELQPHVRAERRADQPTCTPPVPGGRDDDDLVRAERPRGCRHRAGVAERRARVAVVEQRHVRAGPGRAHQRRLGRSAAPARPAAEQHRVGIAGDGLGGGEPGGADRMEPLAAPAGVAEHGDEPSHLGGPRAASRREGSGSP